MEHCVMARTCFCRGALVIALVGLSAGCGPLLPDESRPAAGTEESSQPGGAVPMQGPHGTPSAAEAKEALLAVLRSGGLRDLSSVSPDKLSRQAEEPVGDGTWQWGPFTIVLSTKSYRYTIHYGPGPIPKCALEFEGKLESRHGRWIAAATIP
jgi:hypothetical protein